MKNIYLLIEEDKETGEGFVRGQTVDENKGLDWAKQNARKEKSFTSTETGFATKTKAFDVIDKNDLQ
jgi:hypothetical protein